MQHEASEHEVAGLTWDRIGERLDDGAVAILPIGAGAKQHGFHMPMGTDQIFADYFARALAKKIDALIWPTLTYGAYPAFVSYAGSVSLSSETFQAVVTEIAAALVGFGARRVLSQHRTEHDRTGRCSHRRGAQSFAHSPLEGLCWTSVSAGRLSTPGAALR